MSRTRQYVVKLWNSPLQEAGNLDGLERGMDPARFGEVPAPCAFLAGRRPELCPSEEEGRETRSCHGRLESPYVAAVPRLRSAEGRGGAFPGYTQTVTCPANLTDCKKILCQDDYYLNEAHVTPRCEACKQCLPDRHLVEKRPCTSRSNRECQCQPAWYCKEPSTGTCITCVPLTTCKPGSGVKTKGTSDTDTVCEECPPGTFSDEDSSTQTCKPRTDCAKLNNVPLGKGATTQDKRCLDHSPGQSTLPVGAAAVLLDPSPASVLSTTVGEGRGEFNSTHILPVKKPNRGETDFALLVAVLLSVLVLFAGLVMFWRRRFCKAWIVPHAAKSELTFFRRKSMLNLQASNPAKICEERTNGPDSEGHGSGEGDQLNPEPLTEATDGISSVLEMENTPDLGPDGAELLQMDGGTFVEPPLHNHTSNHIEKIYIMRADTVIVGGVSEVPSGKMCLAKEEDGGSESQENVEGKELAMHYPEQETEFHPGSDITTPVEEEWEFHNSCEKALAI
ncbi:tumor necrosis factor receptor superfamily member 8 [Lacerta agilis]|uniref:tumor necrosis factor receptor superfamily member 8 n=1 Tax=Lacerta agilis TaxID=80427 RepID=UPI00141A0D82|nr:tumor necrosis factor receptor superfamily member 8 [Lacerta agilis]